ncbi:hypothetical protein TRFO_30172 [Tritrichomonas foetus]|uniref:phosphatidylinositol 3-kinase n=1 Tax=Tritrichomonas foetus TaxID=1144522 RepID=A0A1J4JVC6_9EUKA|nr:hypothetical protein TRFO_30172 [Tritrichomonas foetus]|eukprot:OHT02674.1 hypothetical protein TRFO_30172 [Tritrichomonas foetus]
MTESFLRRATAPVFTKSEIFSVNVDRIDVILPNKRTFTVPVHDDIKGSQILANIRKYNVSSFVICRNPSSSAFYDVLYCDKDNEKIAKMINLTTPFEDSLLSTLFISNRTILSRKQRMAFNVFQLSEFIKLLEIQELNFRASKYFSKSREYDIKVQLPSKLVVEISIKSDKKIHYITKKLYQILIDLYGQDTIKSSRNYKFSTISGIFPSSKGIFKDEPELMSALKNQKMMCDRHMFVYQQKYGENKFDTAVNRYTHELDLSPFPDDDEMRRLNVSLSKVRAEVESERIKKLTQNPLLARMRISESEPPLTAYFQKIKEAEKSGNKGKDQYLTYISMKAELRSGGIDSEATGLSIRVPYETTASQAIKMLLDKLKRMSIRKSTIRKDSDDISDFKDDSLYSSPLSSLVEDSSVDKTTPFLSKGLENVLSMPVANNEPLNLDIPFTSTPSNDNLLNPGKRMNISYNNTKAKHATANDIFPKFDLGIPSFPSDDDFSNFIPESIAKSSIPFLPKLMSIPLSSIKLPPPVFFDEVSDPIKRNSQAVISKPNLTLIESQEAQKKLRSRKSEYQPKKSSVAQKNILNPTSECNIDKEKIKPVKIGDNKDIMETKKGIVIIESSPHDKHQNEIPKDNIKDEKQCTINDVVPVYNPEDYVLILRGMDEVLAGDTPLVYFVSVRQFLLSTKHILDLLLVEKKTVVASILSKEMSQNFDAEDSEKSSAFSSIDIIQAPELDSLMGNSPCLPHLTITEPFSIFISNCFNVVTEKPSKKFCIRTSLINGTTELCKSEYTKSICGTSTLLFNELLTLKLPIASLPRTARISITLYNNTKKVKMPLATINFPVFTYNGWMNHDIFTKKMWKDRDMDYFLTTCESNEKNPIFITFKLPIFHYPVAFIYLPPLSKSSIKGTISVPKSSLDKINELKKKDATYELTNKDKNLLWKHRDLICQFASLLPHMLASIDYSNPKQVLEIPLILKKWIKPSPTEAMTLLDAKFADHSIREYAVNCLESFSDNEIMLYMLQLVQALKYELYADSPLARFLIKRGLSEPKFLGHQLFWQLISEAHLSYIRERFSAILVNFVYGVGSYRDELIKGYKFTQQLVELNQKLCNLKYNEATQPFREALKQMEIPKEFHLPMDPRLIVDNFIIDQCKVMNSKKKPFFLTFNNAAPFASEPVQTLFKVGDDLRQDQLTLQVMKVMEHLWRQHGYDYHMKCYGVLPTGFNQGFIEVVPNAMTEAAIQQERGTFSGVFDKETYINYLKKHNMSSVGYQMARNNFRLSSAGYAVATCVLGIADRHPGNIMVQQDGHFFHIDFGHFLGNFKTKLGYQREKAPFHFSEAAAFVLDDVDSDTFKQFEKDAGNAFNILRHNSRLLITLFMLMLGTGIPELQKPKDIEYLKNMLFLDINDDDESSQAFAKLTKESLASTRTKLNNLFHNIKTG